MERTDDLDRMWSVVGGFASPAFSLERELRIFQLKHWITSNEKAERLLPFSAYIFGSIVLSQVASKHAGDTPSERLRNYLDNHDSRLLYAACFPDNDHYRITRYTDLILATENRSSIWQRVNHLAFFTELRLGLAQQGYSSSPANARKLINVIQREGDVRQSTSASLYSAFGHKSVFIYAAKNFNKNLLAIDVDEENIIPSLTRIAEDKESTRLFISAVRAANLLLEHEDDLFLQHFAGPEWRDVPTWPLPSEQHLRKARVNVRAEKA